MSLVKKYDFNGITVEITKKKMKNMYIRVDSKTGVVKVSVPNSVTLEEAKKFVERNSEWIYINREKVLSRGLVSPTEYITGESILLWGDKKQIEFIPSYSDKGVYLKGDTMVILAPLDSDGKSRKSLVDKWLREELQEKIEELKDKCCEIADAAPKEWHIRDMKTKWGTCNYRDARIWISLNLVHKPIECLEYVMLHELAHLHVPNHGPEFKACMDRFCPKWRQIKKMLNS